MNERCRLWVVLAPFLGLAACASVPPVAPLAAIKAAPVAAGWQAPLPGSVPGSVPGPGPGSGSGSGSGMAVPLVDFWQRFGDPALPAMLQAARSASASVALAATRISRARATQTSADAFLLPQVNAGAGLSRARITAGLPAATTASASVQAGWEIDLFGANAAGSQAATARLRGAQALLADARTAVDAEVASTLTSLRACEAQTRTTQQDAESRAETARLTGLTAQAGFTAPADAALARAGAAQARALATQQRGQCDTLVKALAELTGLAEAELRRQLGAATAQLPQPPAVLPPALPADLLAQRPDLQDAALAVQAAAADSQQAAARQWPRIALSGSIGGLALRQGGFNQRGATWSLGPLTVDFPLFDGGSRAANVTAARAEYDAAVALYRATLRRAVREVETSLVALQSTAAREEDARSAAADFETALVATQARQQGGLASLLDLETARRNALLAQSGLIELQRERAAAWVSLVRALGAGWRADLPTELPTDLSMDTPLASTTPNTRP